MIRYEVGGTAHELKTRLAGRLNGEVVRVSYLPWAPEDGRVADHVPFLGLLFPLAFGLAGAGAVLIWLFA